MTYKVACEGSSRKPSERSSRSLLSLNSVLSALFQFSAVGEDWVVGFEEFWLPALREWQKNWMDFHSISYNSV
jgi:hypothetical protein